MECQFVAINFSISLISFNDGSIKFSWKYLPHEYGEK